MRKGGVRVGGGDLLRGRWKRKGRPAGELPLESRKEKERERERRREEIRKKRKEEKEEEKREDGRAKREGGGETR